MTEEELMEEYLKNKYIQFEPRPDDPDNGDEQTTYITDEFSGIKCVIGGNRSSKTYGTAWLFAHELYTRKAPQPNTPCWIVSKTLELAGMIWSQALCFFIPQDQIEHIRWRQAGHERVEGLLESHIRSFVAAMAPRISSTHCCTATMSAFSP